MELFIVMIVAAVGAVIFYFSTISSYKNAGAGSTYKFSENADIQFRLKDDRLRDTRRSISRGYYSNNDIASGGVGSVGTPPKRR